MALYPATDSMTIDNGSHNSLAFRKQLKMIDNGLGSKDIQKMGFLCRDFTGISVRDLESCTRGVQLFTMLEKIELLFQDDVSLLLELLETIRRKDLLKKAKQFWPGSTNRQMICNYRKMLLDIADNTTSTELMEMTSLVRDDVVEDMADTIQFLIALEKESYIADDNVVPLLEILENKQNKKKVQKYLDQISQSANPMTQGNLYHHQPYPQYPPPGQPVPITPTPHSLTSMGGYGQSSQPCTERIDLKSPEYFRSMIAKRARTEEEAAAAEGESNVEGLERGVANLSVHDNASGEGNLCVKSSEELQDEILALKSPDDKTPKTPESFESSQSVVSAVVRPTHDSENLPVISEKSQTACVLEDTDIDRPPVVASYPMSNETSGICLIINNVDFTKARAKKIKLGDRKGSDKDVEGLLNTFDKFHFTTIIKNDLTSSEMHNELDNIKRLDHSHYDAFVCCILTHGKIGELAGCDGGYLKIREIIAMYTLEKCPTLGGKPKVFFIQACQGKQLQNIYAVDTEEDAPSARAAGLGEAMEETLPKHSDFLLGYATVPGYVSYRSRTSGSWYIKAVYETLNEYYKSEDLLSILTVVNNKLTGSKAPPKDPREDTMGQVPAPVHTLRMKLYFHR